MKVPSVLAICRGSRSIVRLGAFVDCRVTPGNDANICSKTNKPLADLIRETMRADR
jgi:hypothetical protein